MALSVFALIAGVSYTALGPAGEGFRQLQDVRDSIESSSWLGKQLRSDIAGVTDSALKSLQPIQITSDIRGDKHIDELTVLVREAGHRGLTLVHYKVDEEKGELWRESRMAWARDGVEVDRTVLLKLLSFDVEVMDKNGDWQQKIIANDKLFVWPKALRVTIKQADHSQKQWLMPLYQGLE